MNIVSAIPRLSSSFIPQNEAQSLCYPHKISVRRITPQTYDKKRGSHSCSEAQFVHFPKPTSFLTTFDRKILRFNQNLLGGGSTKVVVIGSHRFDSLGFG
jgi:hypothetical protein